jgi:chromosome segregation ATPase
LISKVKDIEEECKILVMEKEDAYGEMDGLLENIEALKSKLNKERKTSRSLEDELKKLEKKIYKELKGVKRHIVEDMETASQGTPHGGSRILHSRSYDQEAMPPKVEIII